jgi:hypothetical protein
MMERGQVPLLPGEQLLWSSHREINYALRLALSICALGGIVVGISLYLWNAGNPAGLFYSGNPNLILMTLFPFLYVPLSLGFCILIFLSRKGMRLAGLTFADLKHYHAFFALTNQRWIAKGLLRNAAMSSSRQTRGILDRQKDILSLPLLQCTWVVLRRAGLQHQIQFSLKGTVPGGFPRLITFFIWKSAIESLLKPLQQVLPLHLVGVSPRGLPLPPLHD